MNDELPEGWTTTTLDAVTTRVASVNPGTEPARTFGYVDISAIDRRTNTISTGELRSFAGRDAPSRARRPIRPSDVLFSNVRTNLRNVALVGDGLPAQLCSTGFTVLRPNGSILPDYLLRWVLTETFIKNVSETQTGTHYPATSDAQVLAQPVTLAPIAEQRRIVGHAEALLEQVNRAKGRLDRVPLILKRFRQSVLAAACSGELTKGWRGSRGPSDDDAELPGGWEWKTISDLARSEPSAICAGPFGTIFKAHDFRDEGVPIIFLRHVGPGEYRTTKPGFMDRAKWDELFRPYSVWGGELLVTKLGDPPGTCAIYPTDIGPAMVTPDVIKMSVDEARAVPRYLMHYLNSEPARQRAFGIAYGATRPRMNLEIFRSLQVPLPTLKEQAEVVRQVDRLFAFADTIERRLKVASVRADKLPQAILSKAFAGELVPTEAELARAEGRTYETADELLKRVLAAPEKPATKTAKTTRKKPRIV